jgi:glycosyltransferase involved in cell wall biosynthesis
MPAVTVVMPAYNAAAVIADAIRSALCQTLPHLEVIVVDDASADGTYDVACDIAAEDKRVRVLRQDQNRGPAACRNTAIAAATGSWIALLDADDAWLPQRLERMLAASGDADVVSDDVLIVAPSRDGRAGNERWSLLAYRNLRVREHRRLTLAEFIRHDLGLLKPVLRRAFLEELDLRYDEQLRLVEDFYLYVDMLRAGARWVQLPEPYYLYHRAAGTLTRAQLDLAHQHVASSAALLRTPAIAADADARSALKRLHRDWRGAVVELQIRSLLRERRLLALVRVVRAHPDYPPLLARKLARALYWRAVRRASSPRRPVPARVLRR